MKTAGKNLTQYFIDANSIEFAILLSNIQYKEIEEPEESFIGTFYNQKLVFRTNNKICRTLLCLSDSDKKRIIKAIQSIDTSVNSNITDFTCEESDETDITQKTELLCNLIILKSIYIRVATGLESIQDNNDEFLIVRKQTESILRSFEINEPIEFIDLWEWYKFYKKNYGTYQERRNFIHDKFDKIIKFIFKISEQPREEIPLTGWERIDRVLTKTRDLLTLSKNEEDFQQVGLYCREIFITLGQLLYKPNIHKLIDETKPSNTDAKRLIETYIENELKGESKATLRKHLRSSVELSVGLQHSRTANYTDAGICLEATYSVISIVKIIELNKSNL